MSRSRIRSLTALTFSGLLGGDPAQALPECRNPVSRWSDALAGPSGLGLVNDVAIDPNGNVIFAGTFGGSLDFDPGDGTDVHTAPDNGDFVTMLRSDGSYGWTRTFIAPYDGGRGPNGIAAAPNGDVLLAGEFSGTVDFDPGEGVDQRTASGHYTPFLIRFSRDGDYLGTLIFGTGTVYGVMGAAVSVDSAGNVYVTGNFYGETADFDPTDGVDDHTGTSFVTRFNADGSYGWTRTWGNGLYGSADAVGVDPSGEVFLRGEFRGTVDFDPGGGQDVHTAHVPGAVYVTKLHADGSHVWTRSWDGVLDHFPYKGMAVDNDGNVLITDSFSGTRDFDPTPDVEDWHGSEGPGSVYVTKLAGDGVYLWTRQIGGSGGAASGHGIAVGPEGEIALTGFFYGTVDFDPGESADDRTSKTVWPDAFVTLLHADGSYSRTRTFGGTDYDFGDVLTVDADGSVVVGGSYGLSVDFDPGCAEDIHDNFGFGVSLGYVVKLGCVPSTADSNADGVVNLLDFAALQNCFSGSAPTTCNPGCYQFDFDGDDDIDLSDFAALQGAWSAP